MTFMRKLRAINLFLMVGISPKKATAEQWRHANAVLRTHNDMSMAAYKFGKRTANG